jgi:hypothetical protein
METPKEIKGLVDQLGQALVQAISTDEEGQKLMEKIQEAGFDIGVLLEATLILHPKDLGESDVFVENSEFDGAKTPRRVFDPYRHKGFEWSEEDKALMCNFRISLD